MALHTSLRFLPFVLLSLFSSCYSLPPRGTSTTTVNQRQRARGVLDNAAPSETTIYVCQNFFSVISAEYLLSASNWYQPCRLLNLYPENNGQQDFWMAPAPGGPGPFGTGNYTIGSWGPSPGVTTFWVDHYGNTSELQNFPGNGNVDSYWGVNVWTWFAYWDESS